MTIRIAILDDYSQSALRLADWSALDGSTTISVLHEHIDSHQAAAALAGYEVLCTLRERMDLPGDLLQKLPSLKLITVVGGTPANLDLNAATAQGIVVCSTRPPTAQKVPSQAAAELAWGLIIATTRHIAHEHERMRAGLWQYSMGMSLSGRTLGLLGLGGIGKIMAGYARAFGMDVIAWSQNLTADAARETGVQRVEKDELFKRSDVLSIHYALSPRSQGLVGAHELSLMKSSAYLVNTSRAAIVDEQALLATLREHRIAGAGLDVFHQEPLPPLHPLRTFDNVTLTPHIGYVTEGTLRHAYTGTAQIVAAYLSGKPINVLNTAALSQPRQHEA